MKRAYGVVGLGSGFNVEHIVLNDSDQCWTSSDEDEVCELQQLLAKAAVDPCVEVRCEMSGSHALTKDRESLTMQVETVTRGHRHLEAARAYHTQLAGRYFQPDAPYADDSWNASCFHMNTIQDACVNEARCVAPRVRGIRRRLRRFCALKLMTNLMKGNKLGIVAKSFAGREKKITDAFRAVHSCRQCEGLRNHRKVSKAQDGK